LRTLALWGLAASVVGCTAESNIRAGVDGVRGPHPDIVILPSSLQFPLLGEGETSTQRFTVYNRGQASLDVSAVEVVTSPEAFSVSGPEGFELEIDQSRTFEVTFTPTRQGDNFGRIEFVSDDPDEPRAPVDLLGAGSVPDLEITPKNFSFGEAFVPCGDDANLKLENVGSSDIVIDDVRYESSDGDMRLLELDDVREDLPITLAPGDTEFVRVRWRPGDDSTDNGTFVVHSNDPVGEETAKQSGAGVFVGQTSETFTVPGVPPVDVMFLIDQSCSMQSDNEDTLEAGLPEFFGKLRELSDWQLVQINGGQGCANGGIFDGTTPQAFSRFFNSAFEPNSYISEMQSERLFQLAQLALDQTGPGGCNEGFVRDGALLHLIFASDEYEQSGIAWATHLQNFRRFVAHDDLLRVSAIVDEFDRPCSTNGSGPWGYKDAADATGGAVLDICTGDWGPELPDLAEYVLEGVRSYNLERRAVPGSIEVQVNGTPTTDFAYADDAQTVTVLAPPIGGGDTVTFSYVIGASCPD